MSAEHPHNEIIIIAAINAIEIFLPICSYLIKKRKRIFIKNDLVFVLRLVQQHKHGDKGNNGEQEAYDLMGGLHKSVIH